MVELLQAGCPSCHPTNSIKACNFKNERQIKMRVRAGLKLAIKQRAIANWKPIH